jgi:hypothetical protein
MKKDFELRNIKRIDYSYGTRAPSLGWWVRFKRKGEKFNQFFSDNIYGSEKKSLEAAKLYRDAIEKELGIAKVNPGVGGAKNKSGTIGVSRAISISKKSYGTYTYYFWQAHWTDKSGKRHSKKFPVSEGREEEALRLAIEARKNGMTYTQKEADPLFVSPENDAVKIWRYMDFTKFVSILENKGLFFPRADNLGDPFEGSFSSVNQKLRPLIYKHSKLFSDEKRIGEIIRNLRSWVVISCWHVNEYESAGMWNLYARTEEAVCIQSTYKRLRDILSKKSKIGLVKYVDYRNEWIPESNILAPFMYKRKSFEHERELRAVINLSGIIESASDISDIEGEPPIGGIWVPIDLNEIIEKVYAAPYAPEWFGELLKSVVKTYNLDVPVIKSSLDDEPMF